MWIQGFVVIFDSLLFVTGVNISPCGDNGIKEVLAGQDTVFTCTAEGRIEWRLGFQDAPSSELLATCEYTCDEMNNFKNLFFANIRKSHESSSMTIRAVNRSDIVHFLNSSLQCVHKAEINHVAVCELSYVFLPEGVACTAVNTSWSVTVSCTIGSVYSSRGLYTCHLYRRKRGSWNETLNHVTMVTSPTRERITKNEVKVSGSCHFKTTLAAQEGQYEFYVVVLPGERTYSVIFTGDYEWITVGRPSSPTISCRPHPYVLENTSIMCTCTATSLGQPAGSLRMIINNQTSQGERGRQERQTSASQQLQHSQYLTLLDHGTTWFECQVLWGLNEIRGEKYIANVGYASKINRFLLNGNEKNTSSMEGDQVNFLCESDGRPTPKMSIYNHFNDTVTWTESSSVNYTFIASCEGTASYTCTAWNEINLQSDMTTSRSLDLCVFCKPRSVLSTYFGEYNVKQQSVINFDLIAYPVPHEYHVWLLNCSVNSTEGIENEVEGSMINITCKAGQLQRYLCTCTLTVVNTTCHTAGHYKIQVINEAGGENFSVVITFVRLRAVVNDVLDMSSATSCKLLQGIIKRQTS